MLEERCLDYQEVMQFDPRDSSIEFASYKVVAVSPYSITHSGFGYRRWLTGTMKIFEVIISGNDYWPRQKKHLRLRQKIYFHTFRDEHIQPRIKLVHPVYIGEDNDCFIQFDFDRSWTPETFWVCENIKFDDCLDVQF